MSKGTKDVVVLTSSYIYHGKLYQEGETIDMDIHDIGRAVERGQLKIKAEKKAPAKKAPAKKKPAKKKAPGGEADGKKETTTEDAKGTGLESSDRTQPE